LDQLLRSSSTAQERFFVMLVRDLEGRNVDLSTILLSDVDRVSGILQLTMDGRVERIRLSRETNLALHEYTQHRPNREPALIVDQGGRPLSRSEIEVALGELAQRGGLQFDSGRLRFQEPKVAQGPRLVTKGTTRDLFYLYGIVAHPLRRQVVELLGDEGPTGFTQIKNRLNVRVGTLYYHFDMLAGLVVQDSQKRYMLTEAGKDAYRKLRSAEYVQTTGILADSLPSSQTGIEKGLRFLFPGRLLYSIQAMSPPAVALAAVVLGLGAFSTYQAGLETVALFLNPSGQSPLLLGLGFLGNWLLVYAVTDGIATLVFRRNGEHLVLLLGTAYALIPLLVFVGWWDLATALSLQAPGLTTIALSRIVLVLAQAWSLALLARIVSVLKGLRLDKAAVISLVLAYVSIVIAYVRAA
jgi:hypothetical protein